MNNGIQKYNNPIEYICTFNILIKITTMQANSNLILPRDGSNYNSQSSIDLWGGKLLIVSNSNYDPDETVTEIKESDDPLFHKKDMDGCEKNNTWHDYYETIYQIFIGTLGQEEGNRLPTQSINEFFNSLAVYNFIDSHILPNGSAKAPTKIYNQCVPHFYDVMRDLQPDIIVCISPPVWGTLKKKKNTRNIPITFPTNDTAAWANPYGDGKGVKATCIYHPSRKNNWKHRGNDYYIDMSVNTLVPFFKNINKM